MAISLKKRNFKIEKIGDLKGRSLLTFQGAREYLGPEFAEAVKSSPDYREIAKQQLQINLLYGDRVDLIVLDKYIFYHHRQQNTMVDTSQPIDIWHVFPEITFNVGFVDKQVRR